MNKTKTLFYVLMSLLLIMSCSSLSNQSQGWADRTLKKLSLREKIAQMMIYRMQMRFKDVSPEKWNEIIMQISSDGIGGIHLWYGDASSSLTLMNEMQKASKIPILFDADIEYGLNQRFPSATDLFPLMAIAATGNPDNAYVVGKIIAEESRAVGVHWNFSPVVDVNNNPANPIINTRSFGEDPILVGEYGVQFMKGLQDHGMLSTAKHFPGHGDTETDSHSSLAMIPSDSARLWSIEIPPFKAMIDAGVDAVMVAHVHAPDYQPEANTPASMDSYWIQDILRDRLNFSGTIVTDAMGMGGITKNYSDAYALIEAIDAGCDVIIQNYDIKKSINTVEEAVKRGQISEERINQAALKMLRMKEKVGLHLNSQVSLQVAQRVLSRKESRKEAKQIASEAITCVKMESNLIPFSSEETDTLYVIDIYDTQYDHSISGVTKGLRSAGIIIKPFQVDESDSESILQTIVNEIPSKAKILINTSVNYQAWKNRILLPDNETRFVKKLIEKSDRIVLASMGTPYLIQEFPEIPVYLCAYKSNGMMQEALLNALLGKTTINGKLPVTIPGVAELGHGIAVQMVNKTTSNKSSKPGPQIIQVMPSEIGVNTDVITALLNEAVEKKAWPGSVLLGAKDGKIFIQEAVGYHTYDKKRRMRKSDIFDLASITKVIATTSAIMKLYETGSIQLDDPLVEHLPKFKGKQKQYFDIKSGITIKNLLTHTGGLPPFRQYFLMDGTAESRLDSIYNTEPIYGVGDTTVYSDVGIIVLGKLVESISGTPLDEFVQSNIFEPLCMNTTFYNPPSEKSHRVVPTEIDPEGNLIRSYVHDENAYSLGGVAGHAGLFSTAKDLGVFSQMMLNTGLYGWKRIFKPETVDLFTKRANVLEGSSRCLGWDSPSGKASGGVYLSASSFGHTGFTGTSLWIDPENAVIVILLTNAVHPNRKSKDPVYYNWRQRIHSSVYETLGIMEKNPSIKWRKSW